MRVVVVSSLMEGEDDCGSSEVSRGSPLFVPREGECPKRSWRTQLLGWAGWWVPCWGVPDPVGRGAYLH